MKKKLILMLALGLYGAANADTFIYYKISKGGKNDIKLGYHFDIQAFGRTLYSKKSHKWAKKSKFYRLMQWALEGKYRYFEVAGRKHVYHVPNNWKVWLQINSATKGLLITGTSGEQLYEKDFY